jgi:type IV pilus assembly protein PilA
MLARKKIFRMSTPVVVIGFIFLIPSVLGMMLSAMLLFGVLLLPGGNAREGFTAAHLQAQETAAVTAITKVHTAEIQYYSNFGRFAASMQELGPPATGVEGPFGANLIEPGLASGEKGGYSFMLTATPAGYAISAVPDQYGITGSKTYFSDQSLNIHQHNGHESASANDPVFGNTPEHNDDGAASSIAAVLGGGFAIALGVAAFVGGLLGWLLVMKKRVLQCSACSAVVNAS